MRTLSSPSCNISPHAPSSSEITPPSYALYSLEADFWIAHALVVVNTRPVTRITSRFNCLCQTLVHAPRQSIAYNSIFLCAYLLVNFFLSLPLTHSLTLSLSLSVFLSFIFHSFLLNLLISHLILHCTPLFERYANSPSYNDHSPCSSCYHR